MLLALYITLVLFLLWLHGYCTGRVAAYRDAAMLVDKLLTRNRDYVEPQSRTTDHGLLTK